VNWWRFWVKRFGVEGRGGMGDGNGRNEGFERDDKETGGWIWG